MKNLILFLLLSFLLTYCDSCCPATYSFSINYDPDAVVSKEEINKNIGKAISVTRAFDSGLVDHMSNCLYDNPDYSGWKLDETELTIFSCV